MPTQAEIDKYSAQIYNTARRGTGANPGLPVTLSNLLVAQAKHETGNFGSNAFLRYNNAFGYSYVKGGIYQIGPGLTADNGVPVAAYSNIENSTREMIDWIWRRRVEGKFPADLNTITTPAQYGTLLKSAGYYGDTVSNYIDGLTAFFKVIPPGTVAVGAVAIFGAILAYVLYRENPALFRL